MDKRTGLILFLALLTVSLTTTQTFGVMTPADNKAKQKIFTNITDTVNSRYDQYKMIMSLTKDNVTHLNYNSSGGPIIVPVEICGNGIDDDGDGLIDEGCPIKPGPIPDKPSTDVNETKWLRVVSIGDIDNNNGLTTQLQLANKYNAKIFIVAGDYGYKDCQAVINKMKAAGFNRNNSVIIQGNHDCSTTTKDFNNWTVLYGNTNFPNIDGKLAVFAIDANQGFGCTSQQFTDLKGKIESSDAWYNLAVVHQPFVTVKSQHGPNGQFDCWNPLFAANGIDTVIQAHNHNYQRIDVNGRDYFVVGTGTHDTGGNMYPLNSDNWNGFKCQKCITGTNGITIMDYQIDNATARNMHGWFLSNSEQTMDKFQ